MRKFRVRVNGNAYDVEVDEVGVPSAVTHAPVAPTAPAVPTAQAAPAKPAAPSKPSGSGKANAVKAPMPGTIIDIKVKAGDKVEPRTVVMMLEAMKMENEIFAGRIGVVRGIAVEKGASVNTGDALLTIDPA
ncbi:MAG: biotin/lipoyl-containing protein [Clostridia bacterium]|nr:biotin/lipoyl-containing protein [Clostridia bacterium]